MAILNDLKPRPPRVLIWGKPGCGKTPFVMSYGAGLQLIDCDDGMQSSRKLKDQWTTERAKVDVVQVLESDPSKGIAWLEMKKLVSTIYDQAIKGTYPFKVLAIDSFTMMSDYTLRNILHNSGDLNKGTVSQAQWGLVIQEIQNLFTYLFSLPIPVVVTFHDRETEDDKGVVTNEISIFTKKLPRIITTRFGEILWMKSRIVQGTPQSYLQSMPENHTTARSRSMLPDGFKATEGLRKLLELVS